MAALGFMEILVLLFAGYGTPANDLVFWIDADEYFKSRNLAITAEDMVDHTVKDPRDAKTQIVQLLAIRWLEAHPAEAKKAKAGEILKQIAQGEKAQDPHRFSREYALRALAMLEGKPVPATRQIPAASLRTEAWQWFPADVTILMGFDQRASGQLQSLDEKALRSLIIRSIPAGRQKEIFTQSLYKFAETVGNVRVDRFVCAFDMEPNRPEPRRIFFRVTGAAERKRLVEYIRAQMPKYISSERKGPKGETITLLDGQGSPVFALIGDTDLLVAGYARDNQKGLELVEEILKVRAGDKPSVAEGPLAGMLKEVPDQANSVAVGDLSEQIQQAATGEHSPFRVFPNRFAVDVTRKKSLLIRLQGSFKDEDRMKTFMEDVGKGKAMAVDHLERAARQLDIKPETVDLLIKTLKSPTLEAKGKVLTARVELSGEVLQALWGILEEVLKQQQP